MVEIDNQLPFPQGCYRQIAQSLLAQFGPAQVASWRCTVQVLRWQADTDVWVQKLK